MEVILAGSYLIINSILDIRKREINIRITGIFAVIGIMMIGLDKERVFGILIGFIMVGIARAIKGFGVGDGIVITMLGMLLGLVEMINILIVASLAASMFGGLLIMAKKRSLHYELPFVPFLLFGFLLGVLL